MKRLVSGIAFGLFVWAGASELYGGVYSQNFSGVNLTVYGEYINAVPVPLANQLFAPKFSAGQTVAGSITYDPTQPDTDPSPNTGTYKIGSLFVQIPEIGLSASRGSSSMQISAFNDTPNSDDQFFAYVNGTDSFLNSVGLPDPVSFSVLLFGNTPMLVNDLLPTTPLDWHAGNVSFNFQATGGSIRQVLMGFSPVPEPSVMGVLTLGLVALAARAGRKPRACGRM
jgi:hypothetical protein